MSDEKNYPEIKLNYSNKLIALLIELGTYSFNKSLWLKFYPAEATMIEEASSVSCMMCSATLKVDHLHHNDVANHIEHSNRCIIRRMEYEIEHGEVQSVTEIMRQLVHIGDKARDYVY